MELQKFLGAPSSDLDIKFGFPPKKLSSVLPNEGDTVGSVLRDKETLIVSQNGRSVQAAPQKKRKTPTKKTPTKKKATPKRRKKEKKSHSVFSSSGQNALDKAVGELGVGLARAADGDPTMDFFRNALSEGLRGAEAISKGTARMFSIMSNNFSFEEKKVYSLSSGVPTKIVVTFMDISKKKYKEEIDLLPAVLLKAVLLEVVQNGGTDFLRPDEMARCSPRVFWSIVKAHGPEIEMALRALLPDVNWTKIKTRKRRKSAKALENELQEKMEAMKRKSFFERTQEPEDSNAGSEQKEEMKTSENKPTSGAGLEITNEETKKDVEVSKSNGPSETDVDKTHTAPDIDKTSPAVPEVDKTPTVPKPKKKRFRPGMLAGMRKFSGKKNS